MPPLPPLQPPCLLHLKLLFITSDKKPCFRLLNTVTFRGSRTFYYRITFGLYLRIDILTLVRQIYLFHKKIWSDFRNSSIQKKKKKTPVQDHILDHDGEMK